MGLSYMKCGKSGCEKARLLEGPFCPEHAPAETHSEQANWHGFVEGFHISGLCRYCGEPRLSSRHVIPAETHSEKGQCENCELLQAKLDATLALMEVHELDFKQQLSAMPHSEKGLRERLDEAKLWHRHNFDEAMADERIAYLEQALAATPAVEEPESRSIQHRKNLQRAVREPGPTRLSEAQIEYLADFVKHLCVHGDVNANALRHLLSSSSAGPTRYNLTVRPWAASDGSTVHDETVSYEASDPREAILALYAAGDYEWTSWRLIDVRPSSAGEAAHATHKDSQ
jgi:hypothetical protein